MALPSIAKTTVEVLHPVMVTERGTTTPDWSQPPASIDTVPRCSWQPVAGTEDRQNREAAAVTGSLFMPPTTTVGHHDRIRISGRVYTIAGEPEPFETGLGSDHVLVQLNRWKE